MSTSTAVGSEVDHLDWAGIACDMSDECGKPSTWWAVCLNCALHVPSCNKCRRELTLVLTFLGPEVTVECDKCHSVVDQARPGDLIAFVPIGA